ncbi:MAG: helicase-related protein, partial [Microthrixaceae bacterium]
MVEHVSTQGVVLLAAPPGTGKTTLVPPALAADSAAPDRRRNPRVVLVVPRRIAARAAAARMAANHGEAVGASYGYSVRGERRVGPDTVVEAVTPGLLLRRLQGDPELRGVGTVVLDEFHERSVEQDLLLALLIEVREALRDDLGLVVMSATLPTDALAAMLSTPSVPTVPVVDVEAPLHPVTTTWHPGSVHDPLADRVTDLVIAALGETEGDVLVFLPGRGEIRAVERVLARRVRGPVSVKVLHGTMSPSAQDEVLAGSRPGERRVILATSIAETSLTVPGVRAVVDSGLRRTVRVDPTTGLPTLDTSAVSLATAQQRRGRAAREAPGRCLRMWAERDEETRRPHDPPEILESDLSGLLLVIRAWGADSPGELRWLDEPPEGALATARLLLVELGATDARGRLTDRGRSFARVGFHPRIAAIATAVAEHDATDLGARLLATLEVGDTRHDNLVDAVANEPSKGPYRRAVSQWTDALRALAPRAKAGQPNGHRRSARTLEPRQLAELVLAGYPDRIARRRRDRPGVYLLRSGGEVELRRGSTGFDDHDDWIVAIELDARRGGGGPGRLHLGCPIPEPLVAGLLERSTDDLEVRDRGEWDPRTGAVRTHRSTSLGAITLDTTTTRSISHEHLRTAVIDAVRAQGPSVFANWGRLDALRSRVAFVRASEADGAP